MWKKIELPGYFFERMIGFSLPLDDKVIVISYSAIHVVDLHKPDQILDDSRYRGGGDLYDKRTQTLAYNSKTFTILGLYGGQPLLENDQGEYLLLDPEGERLEVRDSKGVVSLGFDFEDLSGDWAYATFSIDYRYILLGLPYDIYIFRRDESDIINER